MGLLDQLAGQVLGSLGGGQGAHAGMGGLGGMQGSLLQAVIELVQNSDGGLNGLLAKLSQGGLAQQAVSWVSTGQNLPVSAEQIGAALGGGHIEDLAAQLGMPAEQVAGGVAELLPQVVDHLTPDGQVPGSNDLLGQGLAALGAMLGSKA
jgi:uncharacterized protein YidB (DUF937 family)